jgi:hypothetical protein
MNYITADNAILDRLEGILEPVEIRHPSGKVLGHYRPVRAPAEAERYEQVKGLFDLKEAERVAAVERGLGCTSAEVMRHLKSLEPKG